LIIAQHNTPRVENQRRQRLPLDCWLFWYEWEDALLTNMNRVQENLVQGGVSDFHHDGRGRMRSVRALHGINSKISLNKGLGGLAEKLANGQPLESPQQVVLN
jgi:hypothetical protein